jgi:hypothetical protein
MVCFSAEPIFTNDNRLTLSLTIDSLSDTTYLVDDDTGVLPLYHLSVVYLGILYT